MTTQPYTAVFPDGRPPNRSLDDFFSAHRAAAQAFVIDPSRRTTLVGKGGIRLHIRPNAFADASGWPVREPVTLLLHELYSRSDMILAGMTNTSEDRVLESAGQFYLEARSAGGILQLATPMDIDLPLRSGLDNPLALQLFCGGVSQTSSVDSGYRFDWKAMPGKSIQLRSLGQKRYLNFQVDRLDWWNCTTFFQRRRGRIMLSARWTSADEVVVDDLAAFLVFRDFNAVVRMYPSRHGFASWNIPRNLTARTILIGYSGERLLFGGSTWEPTSNRPISITIAPISRPALLSSLPEYCS